MFENAIFIYILRFKSFKNTIFCNITAKDKEQIIKTIKMQKYAICQNLLNNYYNFAMRVQCADILK